MNAFLYLKDGTVYEGKHFGYEGTSLGELVFNTSMTGYQEILTDPSYSGQIITMTYPLIGNYGVNHIYNESDKIHARGIVVKQICDNPSNYLSKCTLDNMLKKQKIVGIYNLDTRSITKKIRNHGTLKCIISSKSLCSKEVDSMLKHYNEPEDWMKKIGTSKIYNIKGSGPKIALLDFGSKSNIIRYLIKKDCHITVFPYNTSYEEILESKPDGVLLSNGPGDPKYAVKAIETTKKIIKNFPTFGICLGHQIIALACGGDTYKLKFGHRGGNHGVLHIDRDRSFITSQNHGYAVDKTSVEQNGMIVNFINLNDGTVEGMKHKELPVFSVQFHPEGAPGPEDFSYLFDKFLDMSNKN
ncbi:glutamine-hydrolyzing carbamoyl-phosphate synthase small subunit [Clostridium sp. Marseille-Q2269]|uniref:glutamine-hydrolyzing carbamoyl-phosphate synthase small subunit n=1 Tax=Clostridium sp. Marseille-Q2269 TaxID=2942205 RepID=UPI002073749F|nr:glutamine-hydrolyzing carbamoyl-phosphate synthase small subunit [Clostridium sp. Marseille-Q2269]